MEEQEPILPPTEEEVAVVAQAPSGALYAASGGLPPRWSGEDFTAQVQGLIPVLRRLCQAFTRDADEGEDLLQNALLKAYTHQRSYQGRGPLSGWLYSIIRHEHEEQVRQIARRRALLDLEQKRHGMLLEELNPEPGMTPEEGVGRAERRRQIREGIERLPEPYREVVGLCDLEELPYEEVAARLGLPVGTVKSRHARGVMQLKELLQRRL